MTVTDHWLLPEGIDEILPPTAARIERLRRRTLDLFESWGYELVIPPLVEYLDALLTGLGSDLELQTFKLTDQLSGRLLGVRADMTPQVARIDAHRLGRDTPVRLCYLGPVLHTRPDGPGGSRDPLQIGAELYGHAGIDSDVEVLSLLVEVLRLAGARTVWVNISHIGIFRGLAASAGLDEERRAELFDILQRKAVPELHARCRRWALSEASRAHFAALAELNGGTEVLDQARARLADAGADVGAALDACERLATLAGERAHGVEFHFDLAEMRGFNYHTGVMFEAFVPGWGRAVAWGGRYDDVGRVFGRARPATGFSTDLKLLARFDADAGRDEGTGTGGIYAPPVRDAALEAAVRALRASGERVVAGLPGQACDPAALGCDRRLELGADGWVVVGN